MKFKTRIIAILLALVLVLSLAGCSPKKAEGADQDGVTSSEQQNDDTPQTLEEGVEMIEEDVEA